jgi:ribosomal protein S27E
MFYKEIARYCDTNGCSEQRKHVDVSVIVCPKCASPTTPFKVPNKPVIALVCAAALLISTGGGYLLYSRVIGNPLSGDGSVRPKPGAVNMAYAIQIEDGGFRAVKEGHAFRGGDRLRLVAKASFPSYFYCFHEDTGTGDMDVVFIGRETVAGGQEITLPAKGTIRMDTQPSPERFTLIASAKPLSELDFASGKVSKSEYQSATDRVFANAKNESKTKTDADWNVVEGGSKDNPLLRASFTLKHE